MMGCPRSGTTLLSALLHAHPDFAVAPETRFLLPAYRRRAEFGDLHDAASRRRLGEFVTRPESSFNDLKLDRDTVIAAAVASPPSFGSVVSAVWREFAAQRGARRWVEKRPLYWRYTAVLLRLFPDAQIVHLVRDPRAVVASLMRVPWYQKPVTHALAQWASAERELRALGRRLPSDSYFCLRYEDLLDDPRTQLGALCQFLDEPFAEQMLDFADAAGDLVPDRKTWHSRVRGPFDPSRVNAWERVLTPEQTGLIEWGVRRSMGRVGYSASGKAARPTAVDVRDYVKDLGIERANLVRRATRDLRERRRHPMDLAATNPERADGPSAR